MRVISGSAKGSRLVSPEGMTTRPTTDRVKEGIFSSLQFIIPGARVLDLFAGSGRMGIECLSRGAVKAVFVDRDKNARRAVKKNLENCGFADKSRVVSADARQFLATCRENFDIIFLDPPYNMGILDEIMEKVYQIASPGGIIVAESESGFTLKKDIPGLSMAKKYRYGKIQVTKYIKE